MRRSNLHFAGMIVMLPLWVSSLAPQVAAARPAQNDNGAAEFIRTHPNNHGYVTPPPPYPAASRHHREQGIVVVRITFAKQGLVAAVKVVKSSGYQVLDDHTINYVKAHWRNTSGKDKTLTVPFNYQLR